MSSRVVMGGAVSALVLSAACRVEEAPQRHVESAGAAVNAAFVSFDSATWRAPDDTEIPNDSLGAAIRRGFALMRFTNDSLPRYAPGKINCMNCHLSGGRDWDAAPLVGSHTRYPKYMPRSGAVIGMADRVNYCFTRSLAGSRLPVESREMQDILAYIAWLSRGIPVAADVPGANGLVKVAAAEPGDTTRGAKIFAEQCTVCHQADGQGGPGIPPLWGPGSYSIGASMAREERAASFIHHNMPLGKEKSLTLQQAFDVSSYINSKPRPDSPGKEDDWPTGGAPADVPYRTAGREPYRPPAKLLPRANARESIVPNPPSARGRGTR